MKIIFKTLKYSGIYIGISIAILCIILTIWALWFVVSFHGESYKYSEKYIINLSVDSTISKIREYKIKNPQYRKNEICTVDKEPYEFGYFTEIGIGTSNIITSTRTSNSTWYHCRFYIEQSDAIVSCGIKLNHFPTEIQLISVILSDGYYKTINNYEEISRKENKDLKRNFETEILDKICNGKWKQKRWYNW